MTLIQSLVKAANDRDGNATIILVTDSRLLTGSLVEYGEDWICLDVGYNHQKRVWVNQTSVKSASIKDEQG